MVLLWNHKRFPLHDTVAKCKLPKRVTEKTKTESKQIFLLSAQVVNPELHQIEENQTKPRRITEDKLPNCQYSRKTKQEVFQTEIETTTNLN